VLASGKGEYLFLEIFKPERAGWKMDSASLNYGCLSCHSHDLIPVRDYANCVDVISSEILNQAKTRSLFLDNEIARRSHSIPEVIVLKNRPLRSGYSKHARITSRM
jgi:hypothetical protein